MEREPTRREYNRIEHKLTELNKTGHTNRHHYPNLIQNTTQRQQKNSHTNIIIIIITITIIITSNTIPNINIVKENGPMG